MASLCILGQGWGRDGWAPASPWSRAWWKRGLCGWDCEHGSLLTPGSRARAGPPLASFPPSHLGPPSTECILLTRSQQLPSGAFHTRETPLKQIWNTVSQG